LKIVAGVTSEKSRTWGALIGGENSVSLGGGRDVRPGDKNIRSGEVEQV